MKSIKKSSYKKSISDDIIFNDISGINKNYKITHFDKNLRHLRPVPSVSDWIFPPVCGMCGKLSPNSLCKKCEIMLNKQCSFGVDDYSQNSDLYFDEHIYFFKYEGIIRKNILNYKFNDKPYLYKTFTNYLFKNKNLLEIIKNYDTIIPVPISKKRMKERGYNQSLLIAKELSKKLEIEICNNCLYKTKNIIEQSKLNKEERNKNIVGVYKLKNKEKLLNKKILIFDDIFTTGNTVNECSKMLLQSNPNKIGILTLAKD